MFKEYGSLSTMLYQFTKPVGHSLDGDIEYYYEHLKDLKGKILEAGVGTGRMMIPFLQKGIAIEGVDISEDMLKQCRINLELANVQGTLYQEDLITMHLPQKYEAIIMPTGSFCLLPRDKVGAVLQSFYDHLVDGGCLMIDLELPVSFAENTTTVSQFDLGENKGILFTSMTQEMDWLQQKTSSINRYELIEAGQVTKSEVANFDLYWYGLNEFDLLLEKNGFHSIRYTLNYEKNETASLVTFFATK